MKKIALGMAFAGLMGGCAPRQVAPAPPPSPPIAPAARAAAASYAQLALSSGQFEMQSAQLALQLSEVSAVRSYAQAVIDQHASLGAQLASTVQLAGVAVPQVVFLPQHSTQLLRLQYSRGPGFESAFRDAQTTALMEELEEHRRYAVSGGIPEVRAFAAGAVPVIEGLLVQARALPATRPGFRAPGYRRSGERG